MTRTPAKYTQFIDAAPRAVLLPLDEAKDPDQRRVIRIVVSPGKTRGKGMLRTSYWADVELGTGNPLAKLKAALCELEGRMRASFEAFEVVDLTRQFCSQAQGLGFTIKGLAPPRNAGEFLLEVQAVDATSDSHPKVATTRPGPLNCSSSRAGRTT